MTFTQTQIDEMAITLADVNGYPWSSMLNGCGGDLGRAVASKTFYRRLAKAALQHSAETTSPHPVIRSPMTDDSTSKHSLSLEPNTGEPASVVVTDVGSLSSSGVLV